MDKSLDDIPAAYEEHWIKRLYVAYGLSFLFDELAENTFPSENRLIPSEIYTTTQSNRCSCGGRDYCIKCYGSGEV